MGGGRGGSGPGHLLWRDPPGPPRTRRTRSPRKDLSFHTHLAASGAQQRGGTGTGTRRRLPRSAPTGSTLALGSNPERVRTASRNSGMVLSRRGSLRWPLPGPAAAAAARSPDWSRVICKCHRESSSPGGPAGPCPPAPSRSWKVAAMRAGGTRRASERERAARVLTFRGRGRLILHHARGAAGDASRWEFTD